MNKLDAWAPGLGTHASGASYRGVPGLYRSGVEHAIDLQSARAEDFEPHLGSDFRVAERSVLFTLARVERYQPQPRAPRPDPFALVFSGPPSVNQGMVALDHPTLGRIELFIVPIGPGPDGVHHYEAVFN